MFTIEEINHAVEMTGQRWGYVGEQYHEGLADWEAGLE